MTGLSSLPYQLLVDDVLSKVDVDTLLSLRQVSRPFQQLADDDLIWKRKIADDFVFPLQSTARTSGWRNLYKGLYNPELYTWGDYRNDRLGRRIVADELPPRIWNIIVRTRGVPFPLQIRWQDAQKCQNGVEKGSSTFDDQKSQTVFPLAPSEKSFGAPIQLHAGGWSFYALTGQGQILAWGSCAGDMEPVSEDEFTFAKPTLLDLNSKRAKSLTVGREHAVAQLDDGSLVEWTRRWDRPVKVDLLSSVQHSQSNRDSEIVQVEAGWDFTAVLTVSEVASTSNEEIRPNRKTNIVLWRTKWIQLMRDRFIRPAMRHRNTIFRQEGNNAETSSVNWTFPPLDVKPITLPALDEPVIKIAAGDNFVIALTESCAVYYIRFPSSSWQVQEEMEGLLNREASETVEDMDRIHRLINESISVIEQQFRKGAECWKKLSKYSDDLYASGVRQDGTNVWDEEDLKHLITEETKITHISAHFQHFAVYSPEAGSEESNRRGKGKGIVILGNREEIDTPTVIPELQGIQVIKVTHGDWHSGALTLDGRVLTWGEKANGALGVWDSLPVPDGAPSTLQMGKAAEHQSTMPLRIGLIRNRVINTRPISSPSLTKEDQELNRTAESKMVKIEKERYKLRSLPERIASPLQVRIGFPSVGEERESRKMMEDDAMETKYAFDLAFAGWHSGVLAIDRSLMMEEEQYSQHES